MDFRKIKNTSVTTNEFMHTLCMSYIIDNIKKCEFIGTDFLYYSLCDGEFHVTSAQRCIKMIFNYNFGDEYIRNIRFVFINNDRVVQPTMLYPFRPIDYVYFYNILKKISELTGATIEKNYDSILFQAMYLKYDELYVLNPNDWDKNVTPFILCNTAERVLDVITNQQLGRIKIRVGIIVPEQIKGLLWRELESRHFDKEKFLNIDDIDVIDRFNEYVLAFINPTNL